MATAKFSPSKELISQTMEQALTYTNANLNPTTAGNIDVQLKRIAQDSQLWGQWYPAFHALLGRQFFEESGQVKNPLSEFKKGENSSGQDIQEIYMGYIDSRDFRQDDREASRDLFKHEPIDISTAIHKENRRETYEVTTSRINLRQLVLKGQIGVEDLINQTIGRLEESNTRDEYQYMKRLLDTGVRMGNFYEVETPTTDGYNDFIIKAKQYIEQAMFPNKYNEFGLDNTTNKENLVLVLDIETKAKLDIQTLANLFNLEKAELDTRLITIDKFEDERVHAVLIDRSYFQVYDGLFEHTVQPNASALTEKHFLHVFQTISSSPFAYAIAFVEEIGDRKGRITTDLPQVVLGGGNTDTVDVDIQITDFDGASEEYDLSASSDNSALTARKKPSENAYTLTLDEDKSYPGEISTITFKATPSGESSSETLETVVRVQTGVNR